jgi:hypothetical protein
VNPDAFRYYLKWFSGRSRPERLYLALLALALLFFTALAVFLRVRLGNWSENRMVALSAAMTLAAGSLLVGAVRVGASIGAWTLLERLESGYRAGHFRHVWHELMVKYRGLIPEIVAHERFHSLFLHVGSDVVPREELSAEQARWIEELLSRARENLPAGVVSVSASKATFAKPLFIAAAIFAVLSAVLNLLGGGK